MYFLYDILLHFSLLLLIPYFFLKMVFTGKYREGIRERFGFIDKDKLKHLYNGKIVWFHAVSVGETKAVLPLVKVLKERHPDVKVLFSTVTSTGNSVAMKEGSKWIDVLIYFPLDFSLVVRRVVTKIRPALFVVVEKEVWPNILRILKDNKVSIIVVNGIISDRSFKRYNLFGFFFKKVFNNISCFSGQTREYADKAAVLGVKDRVVVAGNMKFDIKPYVWDSLERDSVLKRLKIASDDMIMVAGSSHEGEEDIILSAFKSLKQEFSDLKLILAPRHPERFGEVEKLILAKGLSVARRSQIQGQGSSGKEQVAGGEIFNRKSEIVNRKSDVILLDTIGELCNFYSIATIAFVGGTLVNAGGHNLLEPASYKKPVLYGPYLGSYLEMAEMLEKTGGGVRVNNSEELVEKAGELLKDSALRQRAGNAAYNVIEANKGATEKNLNILESYLQ